MFILFFGVPCLCLELLGSCSRKLNVRTCEHSVFFPKNGGETWRLRTIDGYQESPLDLVFHCFRVLTCMILYAIVCNCSTYIIYIIYYIYYIYIFREAESDICKWAMASIAILVKYCQITTVVNPAHFSKAPIFTGVIPANLGNSNWSGWKLQV